jgi:hypothetical protein
MIGWNYPRENNLHNIIEGLNIIPITVLTTITQAEKKLFIANGLVLTKQLENIDLLKSYRFDDIKAQSILNEISSLSKEVSQTNKTNNGSIL